MKIAKYFAALAALFLLTTSLYAMNLAGTWNSTVVLGNQGGSPTFVLQETGDKLTGTYSGALGDAPLHGTVTGSDVAFEFAVDGGTVHYAGKLDATGTKITGTCDYGPLGKGTFTATKGEPAKSEK